MTQKQTSRAIYDDTLIMGEKKQVLYTDVMNVDEKKFLILVSILLHLTQCLVERETASLLGISLQG